MPAEVPKPPQFLTVKQAAERLGLSDTAIYALCDSGDLPSVRVGLRRGRIRIQENDLEAYIAKGQIVRVAATEKPRRRSSTATALPYHDILRESGWNGRSRMRS